MIPILRASDAGELKRRVMNRSQLQNEEVSRIVKEIVARVRQEGDAALFDYTAKFDHVTMTAETVLVTKDEIARAYAAASPEWLDAMREAARRITAFHEKQKQNTWLNFDPAISLGQKITPLKRVGVYVPGGTAAYPSSVLMNVLPAKVAGVKEIIMVTPPGRDGSVSYPLALVAADLAGVDKIYKVGGAQADAALAFGTESIPRVDKITGPGNIFVANAKREVFGHVGIDMVARAERSAGDCRRQRESPLRRPLTCCHRRSTTPSPPRFSSRTAKPSPLPFRRKSPAKPPFSPAETSSKRA